MVPVRIKDEDFLRLRLDIAQWFADRSLDANWEHYPNTTIVYMFFENDDLAYEFMVEFEDS